MKYCFRMKLICNFIVVLLLLSFANSDDESLTGAKHQKDNTPLNVDQNDINDGANDKTEGVIDASFRNVLTYRSIFAAKRREHIDTANRIIAMDDYAKQYKMVELLMETIFPAVNDSWLRANQSNYVAGASPYPTTEEMQGVVGVVFEGIPFFGDMLLRLPHVTKDIYYRQRTQLEAILLWGLDFCRNTTSIFIGHHATQLHLMKQEIGIVPEEPDYVNPYRKSEYDRRNSNVKSTKQKKQKTKKGPKLRRRTEL